MAAPQSRHPFGTNGDALQGRYFGSDRPARGMRAGHAFIAIDLIWTDEIGAPMFELKKLVDVLPCRFPVSAAG